MRSCALHAVMAGMVAVVTMLPLSAAANMQTTWRVFHAPRGRHTPTFVYPARWHVYRYPVVSSFTTVVAYFSTTSVPDPCVRTKNSVSCGAPLHRLPTSGILVTWTANGFPGWIFEAVKGRRLTVGGQPAKLRIVTGATGACPANTQESLDLVIARRAADNWWEMLACIRGPGLTGYAAHVMRMIWSVRGAG